MKTELHDEIPFQGLSLQHESSCRKYVTTLMIDTPRTPSGSVVYHCFGAISSSEVVSFSFTMNF